MGNEPNDVSPDAVLFQVVAAIPAALRPQIVIIGSLAAAYWFAGSDPAFSVRTKDIDSVLTPRSSARETSAAIADKLLSSGWKPKRGGKFGNPGTANTPDHLLPALRLHPPQNDDWFLELLTEPEPGSGDSRGWMRFVLSSGDHYGLPSFQFTGIATYRAPETKFGIRAASPSMMALANLLEHPFIKPDLIEGTSTKRSNKDLGRVLAIAWLSEGEIEAWAQQWAEALKSHSPESWRILAGRAGAGMRKLLDSPEDIQQAVENCNNGLLANRNVALEQLAATGKRLLAFAVEELVRIAKEDG